MTYVDSVFRTAHGKLKGCEDYALCGKFNGFSYGIVADGCGSSQHATLGARLLAMGVESEIKRFSVIYSPESDMLDFYTLSSMVMDAAKRVNTVMYDFGILCPTDYMSTLLCFIHAENTKEKERLIMCGFGDGGFFYKRKDSERLFGVTVEFSNNAPYYPFYETYQNNYLKEVDPDGKEEVIFDEGIQMGADFHFLDKMPLSNFVKHEKLFVEELFCDDLDFALVTSDGIESIVGKSNKYDGWSAARDIFDFKSTQGEFLQRRVNAHFKREEKAGCFHMDDFSAAGIVFNEN